ncbi:MAG TPA: hypothetical protein VFB12_04650 [Ktedonobacteraceae bacterium]|nr:hypothetical protein [Ktedonobacteraceae bacterium]
MSDKNDQERARQEDLMARGPVSRGASNKNEPFDVRQKATPPEDEPDQRTRKTEDYDKMLHGRSGGTPEEGGMATSRGLGTPGGGTLPERGDTGSGRSPGGTLTSDSTVEGAASSPGTVTGQGSPRDRGAASDADLNETTDTADALDRRSQSRSRDLDLRHPQTSSGDHPHKHEPDSKEK